MTRPNTRSGQSDERDDGEQDGAQGVDVDQDSDVEELADQEGQAEENHDADGEGSDEPTGSTDGSDTSAEAMGAARMERELTQMAKKQAAEMEALLQERVAYNRDRADFNQERVKMAELIARAETKLSLGPTSISTGHTGPRLAPGKSPRFSGEGEWTAFLVQFETWMRLSGFDQEKHQESWSGLLGLAMESEAQVFFSGLSAEERGSFSVLKARLEQRYCGEGTSEVHKAKLQSMSRRQPGESLSKHRDSVWLMTRKGYPRLPRASQEQIALDALLRSVDSDLRVQASMKDCRTLDEAVAVMERYEAITQSDPERRKKPVKQVTEVTDEPKEDGNGKQAKALTDLCGEMAGLLAKQMEFLAELKRQQTRSGPMGRRVPRDLRDVECYNCHEKGHYSRECPKRGAGATQGSSGNSAPPARQ
jgi:hypothetical protein